MGKIQAGFQYLQDRIVPTNKPPIYQALILTDPTPTGTIVGSLTSVVTGGPITRGDTNASTGHVLTTSRTPSSTTSRTPLTSLTPSLSRSNVMTRSSNGLQSSSTQPITSATVTRVNAARDSFQEPEGLWKLVGVGMAFILLDLAF
jgi:hypothetical protein